MKESGLLRLDKVYLSRSSLKYSGGIFKLIDTFPVKEIMLNKGMRKNKLYKKLVKICKAKDINIVSIKFSSFKVNDENYQIKTGSIDLKLNVKLIHPGLTNIIININDTKEYKLEVLNSNRDKFIVHEI
jgi:hypothetical protein